MIRVRKGVLAVLYLFVALTLGRSPLAQVRLDLERSGGSASVKLTGNNGQEYLVESGNGGVGSDDWSAFTSFFLTNGTRTLVDPNAGAGSHFFRAREKTTDDFFWGADFRLIDQNGKSRDLYYYHSLTTLKGVVVVFAQGDYSVFAAKINKLATNSLFKSSILFWGIDTDPTNTRTNIAAKATAAGITWPIYHDPLQLATHEYDAHFNGEVFLLSRAEMRVVYRGAIDDAAGNAYLGDALTNLVAGKTFTTTRMEPVANRFTRTERPVADYSTVIAPLLQAKCITCHSPDNIAPFALTSYEDVVTYAEAMKGEILAARMPPWHADAQYGVFHNDLSLSNTDKATLVDWINAGQPRGTGPDPLTAVPPPPPEWPVELGPPDQIVTIPEQSIPATGTIAYRYIYANATNSSQQWLRAAIVKPSNRRVVHHYIVWQGHSTFAQLTGIAGYAPGKTERPFPSGTGILLPANCDLTFNCHYTATGTNEVDQPVLGLWYSSTPPPRQLQQAAPLNFFFQIPPGNAEYEVTASQSFSSAATIFSFSPHMHVRGLRMRFELTLPDGTKRTVCSVPKYDFDWQTIYTLETPLEVPANSRVDIIGAYDNSKQNTYNPDSTKTVTWGEQSWDEMFIGYMEYANK